MEEGGKSKVGGLDATDWPQSWRAIERQEDGESPTHIPRSLFLHLVYINLFVSQAFAAERACVDEAVQKAI